MQALRQIGGGLIIAIVSVILVIGGISLAIAESSSPPLDGPGAIASPTLQPVFLLTSTFAPVSTPSVTVSQTATSTLAIAPTTTQQIACTPPNGWLQVVVGANETIYTLAQRYQTTEDALKSANCLPSYEIQAGALLYVPPIVATAPPIVCGPPSTWIRGYMVQAGDNLFRISLLYRTTVPLLQSANCMGSSNLIYAGQMLYVPNVATSTPVPGSTLVFPSSTATPSSTPPTFIVTSSATFTPTQAFIVTASPSVTMPPPPTATKTSAPANTPTPSITAFPNP